MYYFLVNPYSGSEDQITKRIDKCSQVVRLFCEAGINVLSTTLHHHMLNQSSGWNKDKHDIWPLSKALLEKSSGIILLKIAGWDLSSGVKKEIDFCQKNGLPIFELEPNNLAESIQDLVPKLSV